MMGSPDMAPDITAPPAYGTPEYLMDSVSADDQRKQLLKTTQAALDRFIEQSATHTRPFIEQARRDYVTSYHSFMADADRDSTMPNVPIPMIFSLIEQKHADETKALLSKGPWIEFEAGREEDKEMVQVWNKVIDFFLEDMGFYQGMSLAYKLALTYGTCHIEAIPVETTRTIVERIPVPGTRQLVDGSTIPAITETKREKEVKELRFEFRTYAIWDMLVDSASRGLEFPKQCRGLLKVTVADRAEIIRLAKAGQFNMLDTVDAYGQPVDMEKQIPSGHIESAQLGSDSFKGYQSLKDIGLGCTTSDGSLGLWLEWETEEQIVQNWDGQKIVDIRPNPDGFLHPCRVLRILDPHTQNQHFGISETKPNEITQVMMSDWMSIIYSSAAISGQPPKFFNPSKINIHDLIFGVAHAIPVNNLQQGEKPADQIYVPNMTGVTDEMLKLLPILKDTIYQTARKFSTAYGQADPQVDTATEANNLRTAGDSNTEAAVRLVEEITFKSFGKKLLAMTDRYLSYEQLVQIVGEEDAQKVLTLDPRKLSGALRIKFRGSSRVAEKVIRQQMLLALVEPLAALCAAAMFPYAKILMEEFEFSTDEIEEVLGAALMAYQQQQMMAQAELQIAATQKNPPQKEEAA